MLKSEPNRGVCFLKKLVGILFIALLLAASAYAFSGQDVSLPGNIYLFEEKKDVKITITNNSIEEQELELGFIGPSGVDFEFLNAPKTIPSKKSIDVTLRLRPNKTIRNTTYNATLTAVLGVEEARKSVNLVFLEKAEQEPGAAEPGEENGFENGALAGFVSFFSFEGIGNVELFVDVVLAIIVVILFALLLARLMERRAYK